MPGRLRLLVTAACLSCSLTSVAMAADMMAPPEYDWSGFYLGANFGGSWSDHTAKIAGTPWDPGATAFIGGLQLGYNWQAGIFLLGVEGDFDGSVFDRPHLLDFLPTELGIVRASANQDWIGTLAGRIGVTKDKWLLYGKAGGGWARDTASLKFPDGTESSGSNSNGGWLLGGGLEYAFKPNWTVKLEYDYLGLGNWTVSKDPDVDWNRDVQMIKMGVNYEFGDRLPVPAASPANETKPDSDEDRENLAKAAQNPIADMISVPFQNNANFNVEPFDRTQDVLNIEPVVPLHLSDDWIVISRTIIPLISQPNPLFDESEYGIGDTAQSLLLSPVNSGIKDFSWALGPILSVPSASNLITGLGKVLLGPEAVVIYTPGHWVMGAVVSNSWSVGGDPLRDSVNFFNAQPFLNYNIPNGHGWYLTSSPIITADWNAPSEKRWTVPIGGGVGRVFKVGGQAFNVQAQAFDNVVRAGPGSISTPGDWQFRFEMSLLFPEK